MPNILRIDGYIVYFWSDEGTPREPIHVHIAVVPNKNGTKVWLLQNGKCMLANNNSRIKPEKKLNDIIKFIEDHHMFILKRWTKFFNISADEVLYYDA